MSDFGKVVFIILIAIVFLAIGPFLTIWAINSLAEAGGASFYIEHNMHNYFVTFVLLAILKGNVGTK